MRLIDADEAKKLEQMYTLKPSERALFRLMLDRVPTYEPSNPPLTLEELREMNGDPVYILKEKISGYGIIWCNSKFGCSISGDKLGIGFCSWGDYEKTWSAYRRKPEEGS